MNLSFNSFFTAVHNRLAGFLLSGMFRQFETSQAIADANLQAELEAKIRALQEDGNTVAAKRLESELTRILSSRGASGVEFANELLADTYQDNTLGADVESLSAPVCSDKTLVATKNGRRKKRKIKAK